MSLSMLTPCSSQITSHRMLLHGSVLTSSTLMIKLLASCNTWVMSSVIRPKKRKHLPSM
jgi:hypothetical protein